MMCTCCAAPVVIGLRERRASAGAAISFWLGNSILNPATLVFMGFVLGWNWTALRLVLGTLMVFGLGYLVNRMVTPREAEAADRRLAELLDSTPASGIFMRWIDILWRTAARLVFLSTSYSCCCSVPPGRGYFLTLVRKSAMP
jgi:uncharacterized membrane protein YraQ (UPF0718 family)